jgi:hypothetical protein
MGKNEILTCLLYKNRETETGFRPLVRPLEGNNLSWIEINSKKKEGKKAERNVESSKINKTYFKSDFTVERISSPKIGEVFS